MKKSESQPEKTEIQPRAAQDWKRWLLITASVLGGFVLLNLAIWGIYHSRAYPGVKVGGQGVSNLDTIAIANRLNDFTADYVLKIQVKDQDQQVAGADIDLRYDQQASAAAAVNKGKNTWLPLYSLVQAWREGAVDLVYSLDQAKLISVSKVLAGTNSVSPVDAKVVIEGEAVRVESDKPGQGVDPKRLSVFINEQLAKGARQAAIRESVTEAAVTTKEATAMVAAVQQAMKRSVSIKVGDKVFAPDAVEIGKWLVVAPDKDSKLEITINQDALNDYIASVAAQVDVAVVNKQINMMNGQIKTVSEGKNGSSLNKEVAAAALSKAVITGKDTAVIAEMTTVAFKTRTNSSVDINGKYIEINLSRQRLWAYNDKQLVYETPITSGATGAGYATIQGLFSIKAKQTNRNLNGVPLGFDYNVFVNYWMPFSGNYGMHDASWRSSFGGQDYYYGGSHGCVNLPSGAAAWVYNFVELGTPVWVHS